jgi:hypothetical protein
VSGRHAFRIRSGRKVKTAGKPAAVTMRAIILNGGRSSEDGADGVQDILATALTERHCESGSLVLRDLPIAYCQGCFECWVKTPGVCKIVDAGRGVARAVIQSDLAIAVTPITFGGYSSELKKAIDRIICLVSPFFRRVEGEVHHRRRYARYPAWLGIGLLPAPAAAEERIFERLVNRNAVNFHAPRHASGIVYAQQPTADIRSHVDRWLDQVMS